MVPLRLSLRNFMCYRDNVPSLSLEGIHVACLCGDNGNGKSALVDAITWALWGKSRAKSDEELIHTGQDDMQVELDFAAGRDRYRVIRKRSRSRLGHPGHTILELQGAAADGFRGMTGNSVEETQTRIVDILRMDYQTFINSALILQGKADEFTRMRPGERKEILASILGLSQYDELEARAKAEVERRTWAKERAEREIEAINQLLSHQAEWEEEVRVSTSVLSSVEEQLAIKARDLEELGYKQKDMEHKAEQLLDVQRRILALGRELQKGQKRLQEQRDRVRGYEELLAEQEDIEQGYAKLEKTRARNEELNSRLRQWTVLREAKHIAERDIEREGAELLSHKRIAEKEVRQMQDQFSRLPQHLQALEQVRKIEDYLDAQEREVETLREKAQTTRGKAQAAESEATRLKKELEELRDKFGLLARSDATCPLCGAELGQDGRERIQERIKAEGQQKAEALRFAQREMESARTEAQALEHTVKAREEEIRRGRVNVQRRAALEEKSVAEAEEAGRRLSEKEQELAQVNVLLERGDFASSNRSKLQALEGELSQLGYDGAQHDTVQRELAALGHYDERHHQLKTAQATLEQETRAMAATQTEVEERQRELEVEGQKTKQLGDDISCLRDELASRPKMEQEHETLQERQRMKRQELGSAQEKLRRCLEMETLKVQKSREVDVEAREKGLYEDLVQAFGKKGVQALLIEKALPEIVSEADRLLARMTDGRLHLNIETQRGTKKKDGVIETLDIIISDEFEARRYEMFSGGEAFRINFALRIALAKLLARRAGAPLPTLIIDEGFGTQDGSGRERIIEAIHSISPDFEKILVMTHIEELKDEFPSRINVVKTPEGSMLYLS